MTREQLSLTKADKMEEAKKPAVKRPHVRKPNPVSQESLVPNGVEMFLSAFGKVFMIFPAIVVGIMSGIGAAFEVGLKSAMKIYRDR